MEIIKIEFFKRSISLLAYQYGDNKNKVLGEKQISACMQKKMMGSVSLTCNFKSYLIQLINSVAYSITQVCVYHKAVSDENLHMGYGRSTI